jgi:hypothetical protein
MGLEDMLAMPDATHLAEGILRLKDIRDGNLYARLSQTQAKALLAALVRLELDLEKAETDAG